MSELLKDRLDVLLEKSKTGDGEAQLQLAKCFYRGHLVNKSIKNAIYWAFKAVSSGAQGADAFYLSIYNEKHK